MKKHIIALMAAALAMVAYMAPADLLYFMTFDEAPVGNLTTYTPGTTEIFTDLQQILVVNGGGNNPDILDSATYLAGPLQGGRCLKTDSGGMTEGLFVDFNAAHLTSSTIEVVFAYETAFVGADNSSGNTVGLQYLYDTEWPFGQALQQTFRLYNPDSNGTSFLQLRLGTPSGEVVLNSGELTPNTWYHAAATLNLNLANPALSSAELFINGTSVASNPAVNLTGLSFTIGASSTLRGNEFGVSAPIALEAAPGDHRGLKGAIDALAVSNTVLAPGSFALVPPSSEPSWQLY